MLSHHKCIRLLKPFENMEINIEIFEKENNNQFQDYCDIKKDEKNSLKKISESPFHQNFRLSDSGDLLMDFDATSIYPSAMRDDESVYPKIETGYPFNIDMNDEIVKNFNSGIFIQCSVSLQVIYFTSAEIKFQHLPVKERVSQIDVY